MWTAAHAGVAQGAWQGKAVAGAPSEFSRGYGLQLAARFDVSLYTHLGALTCARYWVSRMALFFDRWMAAGAAIPYVFEAEDLEAWREPAEFTALTAVCLAPRAQRRFEQLRAMKPVGNGLD